MQEHDAPLESSDRWSEIQLALKNESVSDVATRFDVAPAAIRAAQRRSAGGARVRRVRPEKVEKDLPQTKSPKSAAPAPAPAPEETETEDHPVAPFHHLLGTMPDADIGKKAGTTMWVVRGYRLRAGIPAYDRWSHVKKQGRARRPAAPSSEARSAPTVEAPAPTAPAARQVAPKPATYPAPAGRSYAWRVVDSAGREVVVIGASLTEVAATVERSNVDATRIDRIAPML